MPKINSMASHHKFSNFSSHHQPHLLFVGVGGEEPEAEEGVGDGVDVAEARYQIRIHQSAGGRLDIIVKNYANQII